MNKLMTRAIIEIIAKNYPFQASEIAAFYDVSCDGSLDKLIIILDLFGALGKSLTFLNASNLAKLYGEVSEYIDELKESQDGDN